MKKILFAAASAVLLAASCQKTEVINQYVGDSMTFSAGMGKLTKVDDPALTDTPELQQQGFKTWVYAAYADPVNGIAVGNVHDKMSGIDVTYKGGAWCTSEEYFWPANENDLDFFAVSTKRQWATDANDNGVSVDITPVTASGNTAVPEVTTSKMTVKGYSVEETTADDDLMVAGFLRADSKTHAKTVPLRFKHALSKVIFKFNTNPAEQGKTPDKVVVNKLTLDAMSIAGDLKVEGPFDNLSLTWTPSSDNKKPFTATYTNGELGTDLKPFSTWLVIPQDLNETMATISYKINDKEFTYKFKLALQDLTKWSYNQIITYNINLSPNKITFAPVVSPWEEKDGLNTNN